MPKIYFASDLHLGLEAGPEARIRERRVVRWLEEIQDDVEALYLLGDIFDYWYEYRRVIPKGFTRFLGTLARYTDRGIPVHLFTGNHDVWMFDYLPGELGVRVHTGPEVISYQGRDFLLCHGDGLGPGGRGFKLLHAAFHSPILQRMYSWIHPDLTMRLGHTWSRHSRGSKALSHGFRGDQEPVAQFARAHRAKTGIPNYVMGHLHIARLHRLSGGGTLSLLGDWITQNTFLTLGDGLLELWRYDEAGSQLLETLDAEPVAGKQTEN